MSKYRNLNSLVNMTIKAGAHVEYISIFKANFDDCVKIPEGPLPWEHVYDVTVSDKSEFLDDETFADVCDGIGDIFMKGQLGRNLDNIASIHILKFVDKYVVPHAVNIKKILDMLVTIRITISLRNDIEIFQDINLEYFRGIKGNMRNRNHCKKITDIDQNSYKYTPSGTLQDAYVVYKLLNEGSFDILSNINWFRTLKILLVYFNLDHIVLIYQKREEMKLSDKKIISKTSNCLEEEDSDDEEYHPWQPGIIKKRAVALDGRYDTTEDQVLSDDESSKNILATDDKSLGNILSTDDCPYYNCKYSHRGLMIVLSDEDKYIRINKPAFNLLYVMLKMHISSVQNIPESEILITNMNDLIVSEFDDKHP